MATSAITPTSFSNLKSLTVLHIQEPGSHREKRTICCKLIFLKERAASRPFKAFKMVELSPSHVQVSLVVYSNARTKKHCGASKTRSDRSTTFRPWKKWNRSCCKKFMAMKAISTSIKVRLKLIGIAQQQSSKCMEDLSLLNTHEALTIWNPFQRRTRQRSSSTTYLFSQLSIILSACQSGKITLFKLPNSWHSSSLLTEQVKCTILRTTKILHLQDQMTRVTLLPNSRFLKTLFSVSLSIPYTQTGKLHGKFHRKLDIQSLQIPDE